LVQSVLSLQSNLTQPRFKFSSVLSPCTRLKTVQRCQSASDLYIFNKMAIYQTVIIVLLLLLAKAATAFSAS